MSPFSSVVPANTVLFHCLIPWSHLCVCAQSSLIVCDPVDCSPPGFSVQAIFQARILKWVAISSPGDLLNPRIKPVSLTSLALAGRFFYHCSTWDALWSNISMCKTLDLCVCVCVCSKIDPGFLFSWQKEGGLIF